MRARLFVALVAPALMLAACAGQVSRPAGSSAGGLAASSLTQLEDGYIAAKGFATLLLPYVSPARAARIRLAIDLAGLALAKARAADDASRAAALLHAQEAQQQLDAAIDTT